MTETVWIEIIKYVVAGLTTVMTWLVAQVFGLKQGLALNQQSDISRGEVLEEIKIIMSSIQNEMLPSIKDEIHLLKEEIARIKATKK